MSAQAAWDGRDDARLAELARRLAAIRQRIDSSVADSGRRDRPQLIVVTKFHPAGDVARLAALGITDVGENRDQEAAEKAALLQELGLRWHFVGQLQSNKAKSVARYAHAVHSVDRPQLVTALARAVRAEQERTGREDLECYIQVSLDDDADGRRGGALPAAVPELAGLLAAAPGLRLAGVMAVAPLGAAPETAFQKLSEVSGRLREDHPQAADISAGMSQDLEAAVRFGATHLRIGSDILGPRPGLR